MCGDRWLKDLLEQICEEEGLEKKNITFSSWVRAEGLDRKKKQILKQDKINIIDFMTMLNKFLIEIPFPEHLRKAWNQWNITKSPLILTEGCSDTDVIVRTREDYQEDVKFLCTSETVSTHRGHGLITMLCYPVVIELFKSDGSKDMLGLIIMSNAKNKNFDTVNHFEELTLQFVQSFGYTISQIRSHH